MNEKELANKFKDLYEDFDIYEEVHDCDIIVDMGVLRVAIEVKKQFSFKVIEQALRSQRYANMSYVAVPYTKKSKYHFREMVCRNFGIGVLYYDVKSGQVIEKVKPKYVRRIYHTKLEEFHKWNSAGSNSSDKVWTKFQYTVHLIERHLSKVGGSDKFTELFNHIDHHYSSNSSFNQCIRRYINKGILKQFRINGGIIYLKTPPED